MAISKYHLRKEYRATRARIPATYREEAARQAAALLTTLPAFLSANAIACYLPTKEEFDASLVIEAIWQAKKSCYLPVLAEDGAQFLYFVHYAYGDGLRMNRYGILEPTHMANHISPEALDLTITPCVAFDRAGHRLGTGGGYYDRTFAFLQAGTITKPQMMGLAFAAQEAPEVPADPWDISLIGTLTEKGFVTKI